jgi:hypothetical protein
MSSSCKPRNADFIQETDYWCGPAALSYFLYKATGLYIPQSEIADDTNTTREFGVAPQELKDYTRSLGLSPSSGGDLSVPFVANVWRGGGHYVVVIHCDVTPKGKALAAMWDPWLGTTYWQDWKTFMKKWKGDRVKNWGMCLPPKGF